MSVWPTKPKRRGSYLEERLAIWIQREGLPVPVREFRFAAPERQWRFDFAWPDRGIAIEIEGGTFVRGRHSRGVGMREDAEKYNFATLRGWRIFRVTGDMFTNGEAFAIAKRAITTPIQYAASVLIPERTGDA